MYLSKEVPWVVLSVGWAASNVNRTENHCAEGTSSITGGYEARKVDREGIIVKGKGKIQHEKLVEKRGTFLRKASMRETE